jgi:glycosyltransferase involved in cell wall biosynthesis
MRILFLSHYYPPEVNAPANRVGQLARAWAADGHDVTVLTGFPNHPTGIVPPAYRGRPYIRHEIDRGVHVARTPIYAAPNKQVLRRCLNYASYSISAATVGPFIAARPDVVVATSPQFLTAVAGYALARMKRVPFVLEVRDLWPASIVDVGAMRPGSPVVRTLEAAERFLYRHADHIVVVTDSFVDAIAAHGIPRDKISVVKNGVDLDMFRPGPAENGVRERLGLRDKFVAAYIGTHGMAHGLGTILEAAAQLRHDHRYCFLLIGDGAEKGGLQQRAASEGLRNVLFLDQLPHESIPDHVRAADVTLVLLRDRALFRSVIPSKIFEFMGAARPIVIGVDGEARRLVEDAGAGVFVPPEDASALAATIRRLDSDPAARCRMGQSGRDFVERHFSRRAQARLYLKSLERVARPLRLHPVALEASAAGPAPPE